jgi:putative membrane protein
MRFIASLFVAFFSNLLGIFVADRFIEGFFAEKTLEGLMIAAVILTLLNVLIRPFLRLIFTPFIVLTLGLFSLLINAGILKTLDFFTDRITIQGLTPLLFATILITIINIVIHIVFRHSHD